MPTFSDLFRVAAIGIAATAFMDLWLVLLRALHVPTLDFALIGRWAGHLRQGRWRHERIAAAAPVRGEVALGWLVHYGVGIFFAGLLVATQGRAWAQAPRLLPALAIGVTTVLAPWLVMQPAMGAGIAASRTATPGRNRLRSLANHAVFGIGLYLAAAAVARIAA
jgi:hypothetical protein